MAIFKILALTLSLCASPANATLVIDNVKISGNTVSTLNTNGDLTFDMNGTGSLIFGDLTASTVPYLDASKKLKSSSVTDTELGYLSGVTSGLQSQLALKAPLASPTFSGTIGTPLAASRVLTTDASSNLAASSVTSTTLGYLDIGSSLTNLLAAKAPLASPTFTGTVTLPASTALTTPVADVLSLTEQSSTPSTPSSGTKKLYAKNDGKVYTLNSSGTESQIGSGSGSSDNLMTNGGFEDGSSNWTASGGTLSTATSGANFMGYGSVSGTWDSSSASQTLTSPSYTVGNGQAGTNGLFRCKVRTPSGSSTYTMGLWDGTNLTDTITIPSSTTAKYIEIAKPFGAAASTIAIRFTSVASNEPLISIDDCYIGRNFNLSDVAPITDWQAYTPTYTGWGTVTSSAMFWRRVGDSIEIRGRFTAGTTTATEARMSLPAGLTSSLTADEGVGTMLRDAGFSTTAFYQSVLGVTGATYVAFGFQQSTSAALNRQNGNALASSGNIVSIEGVKLPIAGWTAQSAVRADNSDFDWTSYTPTVTNTTGGITNYTSTGSYRRIGDTLEARGLITFSGTPASFASIFVSLPTGLTVDTTKLLSSSQDIIQIGTGSSLDNGVSTYPALMIYGAGGKPQILTPKTSSGTNPVFVQNVDFTQASPFSFGSGDTISWRFQVPIVGWTNSGRAPLLIGSVTSNTQGLERIERATITNSGTPAVASQSGSWISSLTDNGTGDTTINIAAGIFSSTPSCTCSSDASSAANVCTLDYTTSFSATAVRFQTFIANTAVASDAGFQIICMGPR